MERLTYWCDNGHGGGKWFVAIDAEGGEDYGPHVDRLRALAQADKDGKIKAYIVDGFYCDICQKRHDRIKEIKVYLTRDAAEAALSERR